MDNKEKTDVSKNPEELLTAPLPVVDDTETLEKIFSTLKEVAANEETVKTEAAEQSSVDERSDETVPLLNTQDLKNLKNLLSPTLKNETETIQEEKSEDTGESTKAQVVELQTLVDPLNEESTEDQSDFKNESETVSSPEASDEVEAVLTEPDPSTSDQEENTLSSEESKDELEEVEAQKVPEEESAAPEVTETQEEPEELSESENTINIEENTQNTEPTTALVPVITETALLAVPDEKETQAAEEEEPASEEEPSEEETEQPLFILNEPLESNDQEPMVEPEGQTFINTSQIGFSPDTFYTEATPDDSEPVLTADSRQFHKISKKPIYILLGLLALALIGIYAFGVYYYQDKFLPNTFVGGFDMGNQTLAEAADILESASTDRSVTITGSDGVKSEVLASDVGLVITETPDVSNTLEEQNALAWPIHLLINNGTFLQTDSNLNEEALDQKLATLSIISGDQVVKTENAHAVYDPEEKTFVIKEEVFGTEVDVPKLKQQVKEALIDGTELINLETQDLYVKPVILSDNETLAQSLDTLNKSLGTVVTYDFQTQQETLDKNTFATWLTTDGNGEVYFNPDNVNGYVKGLADAYDTLGKPVVFTTTYGEALQYTELYKGWEINQPQEVEELKAVILAGTPVTREPVYSETGKDRSLGNTISGTYLEISIANQTMWYYKDGELIVSTPVVSGDTTQGNGTSLGYFVLQNKETDVVLRGDNGDGTQYASPVTFWLPFNGGIGVHDSSWRGSYGGSIYRGNGSHGCVNTPYSAVRTIYNNITIGDPVVVY